MDYTVYVYKADRRYKQGERLLSVAVHADRTPVEMVDDLVVLRRILPSVKGFRVDYFARDLAPILVA